MTKVTKGKVVYQDLGTGFWGIVADDGEELRPQKMPAKLQEEGLKVNVVFEELEEGFSMFMWGKSVKILDYEIL